MGHRAESEVEQLLVDLCVRLGHCLPPAEKQRLLDDPPSDVDAFTDAVLAAEGYDDLRHTDTRQRVRDLVERHLTR